MQIWLVFSPCWLYRRTNVNPRRTTHIYPIRIKPPKKAEKRKRKKKLKKLFKTSQRAFVPTFSFFLSFFPSCDWTLYIVAADIHRIPWANIKLGGRKRNQFTEGQHGERLTNSSVPFFRSISLIAMVDVYFSAFILDRGRTSTGRAKWARNQDRRRNVARISHRSMALGRRSVIFLSFSGFLLLSFCRYT